MVYTCPIQDRKFLQQDKSVDEWESTYLPQSSGMTDSRLHWDVHLHVELANLQIVFKWCLKINTL